SLPTFTGPPKSVGGVSVPRDLAERVARRREEVGRMAALKTKMIERINTARPKLRKSTLGIKGINADLAKADEQGITTAKRADGKTETLAWKDLGPDAVRRLVGYTAKSADDHLAAGILLLQCSRHAPRDGLPHAAREGYIAAAIKAAEEHFAKAKAGGVAIDRYLDPLAEAAFASAKALLGKKDFPKAQAALAAIEEDYAKTPWLAAHKDEVAAARAQAKAAIADSEAEKLYTQAAVLFKKQDLWALKPVIDRLKADFANAKLLTDAARKPTFAEMAAAVAKLGKFLTVRKDGKGDFTTIQAAIEAAPANSLIEIQDGGPYFEMVVVAREKTGLTLRGSKGVWPVISSRPRTGEFTTVLDVHAGRVTVEQLVIANPAPPDHKRATHAQAVRMMGADAQLKAIVAYCRGAYVLTSAATCDAEDCVLIGTGMFLASGGDVRIRNAIAIGGGGGDNYVLHARRGAELRNCTIPKPLVLDGGSRCRVVDSVVGQIRSKEPSVLIEHSNMLGEPPFDGPVKVGKLCFSRDPQFRDPSAFDYRLKPTSPCRKRASDGGDIGCRFTPEMLEMLKLAHELRKKGIIKF
ncbi:hypothetical protein ACFL09_03780, partial [Planctomycetota bacterium]